MSALSRRAAFGICLLVVAALLLAPAALSGCGKKDETSTGSNTSTSTAPADTTTVPNPSSSPGTTPIQENSDEGAVVTQVAIASARANNPSLGELDVVAVKIVDDWARVDLQPSDKSTDAASWLLKEEGGTWRPVDFGTSIMPSDHPDAPPEVF